MRKLIIILVLLILVLSATTFYFYRNSKISQSSGSKNIDQTEAKALSEKVGKLIMLPTDEIPTIATVSDPEALKDQSFFADAKKGDKVLIYSNAKRAILYDPVANKIITVAPLDTKNQNPNPTQTKSSTQQ